jgi:hypothetical protein
MYLRVVVPADVSQVDVIDAMDDVPAEIYVIPNDEPGALADLVATADARAHLEPAGCARAWTSDRRSGPVVTGPDMASPRDHDQLRRGPRRVPLPRESPDVLARSIAEQADTLRWAESIGGQVTDDRGVQLGGYLLAYLLSRARVRELDVAAGGEAA